jgi:AbiU2
MNEKPEVTKIKSALKRTGYNALRSRREDRSGRFLVPPMSNLTLVQPENSDEDIVVFANHCAFIWSVYQHGRMLFERSTESDKKRMEKVALIFFGDINRILIEYLILQVCKITDPAKDFKKNDNLTVAFLLQHYDFSSQPAVEQQVKQLASQLHSFRSVVEPARNKFISHADRSAILADLTLGVASEDTWNQFWHGLDEFVSIIYNGVVGEPFHITKLAMATDADDLLKALKSAACFDKLIDEPALSSHCADLFFETD